MDLLLMAQRYARYCDWARRSGYCPLDWHEYKALRARFYRAA